MTIRSSYCNCWNIFYRAFPKNSKFGKRLRSIAKVVYCSDVYAIDGNGDLYNNVWDVKNKLQGLELHGLL